VNERLNEALLTYRESVYPLFRHFTRLGRDFLLRSEIRDEFEAFCETAEGARLRDTAIDTMIGQTQEAVIALPWIILAIRPRIARWTHIRFHVESMTYEEVDVSEFLRVKERIASAEGEAPIEFALEVDLGPFNREFPRLQESRSIGRGVEFLNRKLSSELFEELDNGGGRLLDFLSVHHHRDMQLMINDRIRDLAGLRAALRQADDALAEMEPRTPWADVAHELRTIGFEPGWGDTVERARETLHLLSDILEAPSPDALQEFLGRIPMIFSLVILSPHGYFGQSGVLGLPDTGGQVVYILDQVRALEKEMRERLHEQGLEIEPRILVVTRLIPDAGTTTCDQRMESIIGTESATILRVPFRSRGGEIVRHWISRFEVWPYLETFAREVETEVLAELGARPDLIVGNYSDGNLVATLLAQRLHVTQCNIAHALEKTKYLHSDLYWRENDGQYHFGAQFTADLIAMNAADFIITSTYQEIAGNGSSIGQYESYAAFTMPELYRVVNGIDLFDPKFNIVSPGAEAEVYFSFREHEHRLAALQNEIDDIIFGGARDDARGILAIRDKPILFSMARLDRIKNLTGFVEWYATHPRLRENANVLLVAGHVRADASADHEERAQIGAMHGLFDKYDLDDRVRWLGVHLEKNLAGELYRVVADHHGVFVQPALFEAFGLTVIEAMASGLPTFATCYGGPLEIIEDGKSGFHIDPNHGELAAAKMADFLQKCAEDDGEWDRLSRGALDRIRSRFTWKLYADRMMTLSRIYGFWKFVTNLERAETRRYLEMFYGLQFRPLAEKVGAGR